MVQAEELAREIGIDVVGRKRTPQRKIKLRYQSARGQAQSMTLREVGS